VGELEANICFISGKVRAGMDFLKSLFQFTHKPFWPNEFGPKNLRMALYRLHHMFIREWRR
jgi:hypothetical protein